MACGGRRKPTDSFRFINPTMMRLSELIFITVLCFYSLLPSLTAQPAAEQKEALLEQLTALHFRKADQLQLPPHFTDQLIERVNASKLSFDDKFELRYFLTQINFVNDIKGFPLLTQKSRNQLLELTTQDSFQALLVPLVLENFKRTYLPSLLRINESDAEAVQLNEEHYRVEELLQYQLKPGARVGEIGAGDGVFGLFLLFSKTDIQLFLNEISDERIGEISNTLMLTDSTQAERVKPILGTENATLLEGYELDAIIMRNVFHHFSEPKDMLASIRSALQPNGVVYLLEQFKETDESKNHCTLLKERAEIEKLFEENGWVKTEEVYLEKQRKHLLQYRLY